jgi:L-threonylcarbamoyladenylate synthase
LTTASQADLDANIRVADAETIAAAGALIRAGRLVAFPTETVYGLGADATNDGAVAAVFEAKARPRFNPLIVHFAEPADLSPHAELDARAQILTEHFWPGPLTLVLPRKPSSTLSLLVSAGLDSVAVRLPANPIARALITAARRPIAAPSANRSGEISPTTARHVARSLGGGSLGGGPAMILDGGPTALGIESTVVDLSTNDAILLRPGAITREQIEPLIGTLGMAEESAGGGPEKSPGRQARHYAPHHPLRINVTRPRADETLLAFGPDIPQGASPALNLSPSGDLTEAAANLFAMLHELDSRAPGGIAVMPIPGSGLGAAINDRLARAAHPLPSGARED